MVLLAQKKAIEEAKSGNPFNAPHTAALKIIIDGLIDLKLCNGSRSEVEDKKLYRDYFMHRTSHWLGLDVHDAGDYVDEKGNSNYAFPVILKTNNITKRNKFEQNLFKYNIEFRRGNAGGGNQLRQPYLKKYVKKINLKKNFKNVEHINSFGYYIGNYPTLTIEKIKKICKVLNSIDI